VCWFPVQNVHSVAIAAAASRRFSDQARRLVLTTAMDCRAPSWYSFARDCQFRTSLNAVQSDAGSTPTATALLTDPGIFSLGGACFSLPVDLATSPPFDLPQAPRHMLD
jgi:hypothetical protein